MVDSLRVKEDLVAEGSNSKNLISVKDVHKTFKVGDIEVRALRGVSFDIQYSSLVAITGPSGSGKSTLMNLIGCLDVPTSGAIYIDGENSAGLSEKKLANFRLKKVGFVFQQFNLISSYNALENVELPLLYAGVSRKERRERAEKALLEVGLKDRMKHLPSKLSGGQKQRVALARAIINEPSLILADEPTGALDTATGEDVMNIFHTLHSQGRSIIIVTHDPRIAAQCPQRVEILDGKLNRISGVV